MSNRNDDNNRNPINNNNNRGRPQLQHFVERTVQAASALPARFQRRLVITWHALARLVGAYESERKEEMGATEVERINLLLQAVHRFLQLLEGAYVDFIVFSVRPTLRHGDVDIELNRAFFSLDRATLDNDFDQAAAEAVAEAHHPQMVVVKRQLVELMVVLACKLYEKLRNRPTKNNEKKQKEEGGEDFDAIHQSKEMVIIDAGTQFMLTLHQMSHSVFECVQEFESDAPADD
ncbi:hypothetical protein TYRP_020666 [Tyrophagus putrescentiae]|nr:hypothetical protein TYRP_020666 [Tyrophagus putrescentiae]